MDAGEKTWSLMRSQRRAGRKPWVQDVLTVRQEQQTSSRLRSLGQSAALEWRLVAGGQAERSQYAAVPKSCRGKKRTRSEVIRIRTTGVSVEGHMRDLVPLAVSARVS